MWALIDSALARVSRSGRARGPAAPGGAADAGAASALRRRIIRRGAGRADPAPSRIGYRLHRLWLSATFRFWLRAGGSAALTAVLATWYLSDGSRIGGVIAFYHQTRTAIESRPEFAVIGMEIAGASPELAEDIRDVAALDFPIPSFDLDLRLLKEDIEGLDAVASAQVVIGARNILRVEVVERSPAVVWRLRDGLELLDETGHRVSALGARAERADLPLLVGEGANEAVPEALEILRTAAPLAARLRGLVRVGERRWDLVLTRDQRIMLPERDPVPALEQALVLARERDLLERQVAVVDLRNPHRLVIRPAPGGIERASAPADAEPGANVPRPNANPDTATPSRKSDETL